MSNLSVLIFLALSSGPSPTEVIEDLDAHPWRPTPATPVAMTPAESTSRTSPTTATPALVAPTTPKAPKDTPPSTMGCWQLQLGALSNPDAANSEKKRLEKVLGSGTVEIALEGSVSKLRYGKFASKEEAETARAALKTKGVDGFSVSRP